jgi:hypothetical protein
MTPVRTGPRATETPTGASWGERRVGATADPINEGGKDSARPRMVFRPAKFGRGWWPNDRLPDERRPSHPGWGVTPGEPRRSAGESTISPAPAGAPTLKYTLRDQKWDTFGNIARTYRLFRERADGCGTAGGLHGMRLALATHLALHERRLACAEMRRQRNMTRRRRVPLDPRWRGRSSARQGMGGPKAGQGERAAPGSRERLPDGRGLPAGRSMPLR